MTSVTIAGADGHTMKRRLWIVAALVAASCSSPQPPDAWAVERVADDDEVLTDALCQDVTTLALGSHADDPDLVSTLDELARIAALAGATDALPTLGDIAVVLADTEMSEQGRFVALHDLLVDAAGALDDATAAACEIPVFSALYASSGFPDCHFEMEIPVASYTLRGEPNTCSSAGRPSHLPCWTDDGDHLPMDCVTEVVVQAVADEWREAGDPREVAIDRADPDAAPAPVVIAPTGVAACADLEALFLAAPVPNGPVPDHDRLVAAAGALDADTAALVQAFVDAVADPPGLEEFEMLVGELDARTATACGLPLVSAWATLTTTRVVLPCWTETDLAYPAYTTADCTEPGSLQ